MRRGRGQEWVLKECGKWAVDRNIERGGGQAMKPKFLRCG